MSTATTSAAVHEIEQLVPVGDVDAGLLLSLPAPKAQDEATRALRRDSMAQHIVHDSLQGSSLLGGAALQRGEEIVIDGERGSFHALKCTQYAL